MISKVLILTCLLVLSSTVTSKSTEWTDASGSPTTLTTSYTLDANDNITETTHPDGSVTQSSYNAADKLISDTDALGNTTSYAYDKNVAI